MSPTLSRLSEKSSLLPRGGACRCGFAADGPSTQLPPMSTHNDVIVAAKASNVAGFLEFAQILIDFRRAAGRDSKLSIEAFGKFFRAQRLMSPAQGIQDNSQVVRHKPVQNFRFSQDTWALQMPAEDALYLKLAPTLGVLAHRSARGLLPAKGAV